MKYNGEIIEYKGCSILSECLSGYFKEVGDRLLKENIIKSIKK